MKGKRVKALNKAYLTIDDGPTVHTGRYLEFLKGKGITPVMFFLGKHIENCREQGINAIKQGAVIGNHSYSHPHFSDLSFEECILEIEQDEVLLEGLYQEAGVERTHKLFRFPYGDKGGENKELLQRYFKEQGFSRIDDSVINYDWYAKEGLNKDYDFFWTFDFAEYQIAHRSEFTFEDVLQRMEDMAPTNGAAFLAPGVHNLVLIHDHPETESVVPHYFEDLITRSMEAGVVFVDPKFI